MNKKEEQRMREAFTDGFSKMFQNGLHQGTYAIAKVLYDKACDESKTYEERIQDIKKFCEVSLKNK